MTNDEGHKKRGYKKSLTKRLLLFTIIFVLTAEIVIYIPTIVQFRNNFLNEKIASGATAAMSLEEVPGNQISHELEQELLASAQIQAIIISRSDSRQLALRSTMPFNLVARTNINDETLLQQIKNTFAVFTRDGEGVIQIASKAKTPRFKMVEVVVWEKHLKSAMLSYTFNILIVSLLLTLITAGIIFTILQLFVIKPISNMSKSIAGFRAHPEDVRQTLNPSAREDEIGMVEYELNRMQNELRQALNQKTKLAELGMAVSKINHDLRNILNTASLSSDMIKKIADPKIQNITERLLRSVDRAIRLCESTLVHGKAVEKAPEPTDLNIHSLAVEVGQALGLDESTDVKWLVNIPKEKEIFADPDHMFRVILNISQNAKQALGESGEIIIGLENENTDTDTIIIADNGDGIPQHVQNNLFKPFTSSNKATGTGLGLSISKELVMAQSGDIKLASSGKGGTIFSITIPKT